jgi:two-component system, OmpR family, sensor histidine kinase KdpD
MILSEDRDWKVRVGALRGTIKRVAVGGIGAALLTLVCYRAHLDFASAIPLFMLLVVLQSLTGDFRSAVVISVFSAGCLDFFFTEPLFSLYMRNPLNGLTLMAFLFTAFVITILVSRVRKEATLSGFQKDRLDRLYQLSRQLLALEPEAARGEKFLEPFRRLFGVAAISVFDADTAELDIVGESQCDLAAKTRAAYIRGDDFNDPGSFVWVRCLRVRGRMTGAIGFEGLRDPAETGPLTALNAALVERTNAFRKASAAAARLRSIARRCSMPWRMSSRRRWLRYWQPLVASAKPGR